MKKVGVLLLMAVMVFALSGCGDVSDEDAKLAFTVGFVSVFSASMGVAFGQPMDGTSIDEDTEVLTLDKFDLGQLMGEEADIPYTFISGTASPTESNELFVDITMEGGPVKSLSFTMGQAQMQAEDGFTITVIANGNEMDLDITPEDMQGQ